MEEHLFSNLEQDWLRKGWSVHRFDTPESFLAAFKGNTLPEGVHQYILNLVQDVLSQEAFAKYKANLLPDDEYRSAGEILQGALVDKLFGSPDEAAA